MFNVLLCIDIGTTSLKAGLITARGEVVSFCSIPVEDSQNEFAACTWLGAFVKAVCELETQCAKNGKVVTVSTISISGNGPTVVADCGYTVFWNEDFSDIKIPDSPEAKKSLFMPKLLALKKRVPKIYKKSRFIFSGPEYLIYILTGEAVTILPEERFRAAYWNDEVCKVCGIDSEKLPPFIGIGDCCGLVNKEVLAELRVETAGNLTISQNCSVFAGGPDFVVALIGTGTLISGRLCDRCGSSEGLNFCTDKILQGEGLRILPSVIPGLWNASYLIPNSGELSEAERLIEIEHGINCLKRAADEAGINFPNEMAVTGGQTNDELLLREKAEKLKMKILRPAGENAAAGAGRHFVHSELLGDACAAWFGLGEYDSLQSAAENIVRLEPYENL